MFKVVDFWLDLGVDGLRLDAVPYLYEREGTSCENLPETHEFLKKLRAHVDEKYGDRMLLGRGQPMAGRCRCVFRRGPRRRMPHGISFSAHAAAVHVAAHGRPAAHRGHSGTDAAHSRNEPVGAVPAQPRRTDAGNGHGRGARLHVSDVCAGPQARLNLGIRRRLAPLLNNDRKSIELLNALLFSLPGTPVLYYGDEIGLGENIYLGDRNGVRTPMQWSSDKNAGFSRANPQSLYLPIILDPGISLRSLQRGSAELANPHSLLWWMRRMLALRKRWRALGEGKCEFLQPDNRKILSYVLRHENEIILVVANLSRFTQPVELDLSAFKTMVPVELFGRTKFPVITDAPYFLTLGPHNFFWFSLEAKPSPLAPKTDDGAPAALPAIAVAEDWREIFTGRARVKFEAVLPDYFRAQPWFAGQAKTIKLTTLKECFSVPLPDGTAAELAFVQVEYVDAFPELYVVPLAFAAGDAAAPLRAIGAAELKLPDAASSGVLYEAFAAPAFARTLVELMGRHEKPGHEPGRLQASRTPALRQILDGAALPEPVLHNTPDGNAAVIFGEKIALKFFRQVGPGENPELELGRFLTGKIFPHSPPLLGALEYYLQENPGVPMTLAVAKAFVPQAKNGWKFTLDAISRYYDRVFASATQGQTPPPMPSVQPLKLLHDGLPEEVADHVGTYLESARLLGIRTAELHLTLASGEAGGGFSTEPMTPHYLRGVFQSMRSLAVQNLRLLRKQIKTLPPELAPVAQRVVEMEAAIIQSYRRLVEQSFAARRIRIHGDLHLGQMLWTGRDFVFLDFEGEVALPISERRLKRSPLRDVARMVRSFHHAAYAGFHQQVELGVIARENLTKFEPWVRHWNIAVSRAFLLAYCQGLEKSEILPSDEGQLRTMLLAYLLNQVVDELGWELRRGSDNVRVPLRAIVYLTEEPPPARATPAPESSTNVPPPVL